MNNTSVWQDAGGAFNSMGNNLTHMVMQMAQMKFAEQQRAEMLKLKRMQLDQQAEAHRGRLGLYDAQSSEKDAQALLEKRKAAEIDARVAAANAFGENQIVQSRTDTPLPEEWSQGGVLGQSTVPYHAIDDAQRTDAVEQGNKFAGIISALASHPERAAMYETRNNANRAVGGAGMNPRLAQLILTGTKAAMAIPHGGSMGNPVSGIIDAVSPQMIPAGGVMSPGTTGVPSMSAPPRMGASGVARDPNQSWASTLSHIVNALKESSASPDEGTPQYSPYTNAVAQLTQTLNRTSGNTNAPVAPVATPNLNPATRKVGTKVTTPKGTFSWNGHSWDPVQ